MKNWKRLVRILLCAAILTALLTGATALADDPASPSDLTNSASIQVLTTDVIDGAVSGYEYYQLIITLPASANGNFQWGWDTDLTKNVPDEWYDQKLEWFVPYGENACRFITDGVPADVTDEALFIRLNENDTNVQKLIFHYDKTVDTSLTISNLTLNGTPGLLAPVNVTWTDLQGALFKVFWNTPNGLRTYLTGNRPYFKTGNDEFDRVENLMGWVGDYEFWVLPIKDGRGGVPSAHRQFTVAEPDATDAVTLTVIDGLTAQGKAQLNQNIQFRIEAPGAERIRFFNSDWLDEFDVDENGTAERGWMATDAEQAGKTFRFYAQALFINDGVETWVTSNVEGITVENYDENDVLQGDVTWSIVGNPQSAARNSVLTIEAGPVAGADYFAAFITNHGNWVTESHWMRANETGTTLLSLPMLDCEPGDSYEIHVYAAKIGVPRKYSDTVRVITVTAPPAGTGDILFAMKDSYVAGEPLQIRALYTNPNNLQNAWMHIRIYNKADLGDRPYDNGQGFEFRDDWFSIDHAGIYVLEAIILQHVDGTDEPVVITGTSFELTVESDGSLNDISLFGVPALLEQGTALNFSYNRVPGAEYYDLTLHFCPEDGDWMERDHLSYSAANNDPELFEQFFDADNFNHEGRYRIWVHASAYGINSTSTEQYFYVVDGNIATSSDLLLTAVDNAGNEATPEQLQHWPSSKHLEFRLYAPGANAVRFLNYEGNWEYRDGSNADEEGWFSWGRGPGRGTYAVVAQAAYGSAFTWTATSNEIPITVYSNGNVQPAEFTLNKNSLVRGEYLVVTISNWDQLPNQDEWYGAFFESMDGWETDYISWDEATQQIVLPTADLQAGNYGLRIWADAEGVEGAAVYADVTITEPAANSIIFNVGPDAGPVDAVLGQSLSVSIYAPGAQHVGFSVDGNRWDLDENGNYVWGESPSWTNYEDVRWDDSRDAGEHTLQAFAFYAGTGWVAGEEITVTVRSLGKLEFDLTTLPGVVATSTDLIINLPEDADHMNIGVYEDWDDENLPDGYGRKTIFRRRELSQGLTVRIPEENVVPGHRIVIDMDAWAHGYEGDWRSISIPIINAPGDSALIYIDGGDIEQGRVLVDGEVRFIVSPVHDNDRITAVRYYDGDGFVEWGETLTPENNPDWFTTDGDFSAWTYFHDADRSYSVFAEVQLNGRDEWITTNVLSFALKVNGVVDSYDFTDLTPITAARGESVSFTFTPAEGATNYWADAFDEDWRSYNPNTECVIDETTGYATVTLFTADLPAGEYHVLGRAGANPGIQWSESDNALRLNVVNSFHPENEEQFHHYLENAAEDQENNYQIHVDDDLVLTYTADPILVAKNVELFVSGDLTLSSGVTLKNVGDIHLLSGGSLVLNSGSTLMQCGFENGWRAAILLDGGTLVNNGGTLNFDDESLVVVDSRKYNNVTHGVAAAGGAGPEFILLEVFPSSQNEINSVVYDYSGYKLVEIYLGYEGTEYSIPNVVEDNISFILDEGATLTVPNGNIATVYGSVNLNGGSFVNNGTLNLYGLLRWHAASSMTNNGTFNMYSGSTVQIAPWASLGSAEITNTNNGAIVVYGGIFDNRITVAGENSYGMVQFATIDAPISASRLADVPVTVTVNCPQGEEVIEVFLENEEGYRVSDSQYYSENNQFILTTTEDIFYAKVTTRVIEQGDEYGNEHYYESLIARINRTTENGRMPAIDFSIDNQNNTVEKGDFLIVSVEEPDEADVLWYCAEFYEVEVDGNGKYFNYDHIDGFYRKSGPTLYLPTDRLSEDKNYVVKVFAEGIGYDDGERNEEAFSVTENSQNVRLNISKEPDENNEIVVQTRESFSFSLYAPGTEGKIIQIYVADSEYMKWTASPENDWRWSGEEEGPAFYGDSYWFGCSGTYWIYAMQREENSNEWSPLEGAIAEIIVQPGEPLQAPEVEYDPMIKEGDDLDISVTVGENAPLEYTVVIEKEWYDQNPIARIENLSGNKTITVGSQRLAGIGCYKLRVEYNPTEIGYEGGSVESRFRVFESETVFDNRVSISVDPSDPVRNQEVAIRVIVPEEATDVKLYNYYGKLRDFDDNSGRPVVDDSSKKYYEYRTSDDNDGYIYASASVNGTIYTSNVVIIERETVGKLDAIKGLTVPNSVARGTPLTVTYTEEAKINGITAENDTWYNFEIFAADDLFRNRLAWSYGNHGGIANLSTVNLEAGETYVLEARVDGYGYEISERTTQTFTVTPSDNVVFEVSEQNLFTGDRFTAEMYVPGADKLQLYMTNQQSLIGQTDDPSGNAWSMLWEDIEGDSALIDDIQIYRNREPGTYWLYAMKFSNNTNVWSLVDSKEIHIMRTMPALSYVLQPMGSVNDGVTLTVSVPEDTWITGSCQVLMWPAGNRSFETTVYRAFSENIDAQFQNVDFAINNSTVNEGQHLEAGTVYEISLQHVMKDRPSWEKTLYVFIYDPDKVLTLPSALTEIDEEAFAGVNAQLVIIPDGVTSIGSSAFANSSIAAIEYPATLDLNLSNIGLSDDVFTVQRGN